MLTAGSGAALNRDHRQVERLILETGIPARRAMPELARGFVPRVALSPRHGFGTKNHAMLITDERILLLPWQACKTLLGPLIDGGVTEESNVVNTESALSPETLALQPGVVSIPHGVVARLQCRRALNTYFFSLEFRSDKGPQKLSGFLLPSRAYLRRRRKEGVRSSACAREYAGAAGKILGQVTSLRSVFDWRI
jgi:hypothetical protein